MPGGTLSNSCWNGAIPILVDAIAAERQSRALSSCVCAREQLGLDHVLSDVVGDRPRWLMDRLTSSNLRVILMFRTGTDHDVMFYYSNVNRNRNFATPS